MAYSVLCPCDRWTRANCRGHRRGSVCTDGVLSVNGLHRSARTWISFMPKAGPNSGYRVRWVHWVVSRRGFDSKIEQISRIYMMLCVMSLPGSIRCWCQTLDVGVLLDLFFVTSKAGDDH